MIPVGARFTDEKAATSVRRMFAADQPTPGTPDDVQRQSPIAFTITKRLMQDAQPHELVRRHTP
jgi:hypothetical protein